MLKKRIIFNLLVSKGVFQLSRNFTLQNAGNLQWLYDCYNLEAITKSVDELIITHVSRNQAEEFESYAKTVTALTKKAFVPLTLGGGIRTVDDAKKMIDLGADKIMINSLIFTNPDVVKEIATIYGEQCIVGGIDFLLENDSAKVLVENGSKEIELSPLEAARHAANVGVGELMITSIQKDGTGMGLDIPSIEEISNELKLPIIAAGGVGKFEHFINGLNSSQVSAVATANIFNFMSNGLIDARKSIEDSGISLAKWEMSL